MLFCNDTLSPAGNGLSPDEWRKGAVAYQIYPRSFKDSNSGDIGDLEEVCSELDYLQALGVDVLWLSPICTSPQTGNGHDIADYYDINSIFGTLSDFDRLLEGIHERGMHLVMDLVINHSFDGNPWFVESRSSRESPKHDWYVWRDPHPGCVGGDAGAEPNNWGSFFFDPAWAWNEAMGQYCLHLFHKKQPDLNWKNPQVRATIYGMMDWWLDRGVDGFRMDAINLISRDSGLSDSVVYPGRAWGGGFLRSSEGPRLHEYLAEMRRRVFDGRADTMTVGECPDVRRDNVLLFTDLARYELNVVFQFDRVDLGLEAGKFRPYPLYPGELANCLTQWREARGEADWNSLYLDNRGQLCAVSRFDGEAWRYESATALVATLHTLRGTPCMCQGEELGMIDGVFEGIDDYRDVGTLRHYRETVEPGRNPKSVLKGLAFTGRDNTRTPIQWDASKNAGFAQGTSWIGITPSYRDISTASQIDDLSSMYTYYHAFADIRHGLPVIAIGAFERIAAPSPAIFAYRRALGEAVTIVPVNLSSQSAPLGGAARGVSGDLLLANRDLPEGDRGVPGTPGEWEALVYIR